MAWGAPEGGLRSRWMGLGSTHGLGSTQRRVEHVDGVEEHPWPGEHLKGG